MHSTFDFPGGGEVQNGGRDLQQHPRHSGGAVDQARADSVEDSPCQHLTRPELAGADSGEEKACHHPTRLSTELKLTVWKSHLANTRLAVYHASF